ncbi:unnamed protein product [Rhizoctonia solani]|uniref:Uncharacterized protein n=1 Tax=Rhizoctonia solani TaxID=456999 RepID=A0A8H2WGA1_9AGAM|nr:unnamed protein product [Rhizoctonia solani]
MSDSWIQASTPRTPPSRPSRHRVDSFPTDDIHEELGLGEDAELSESASGMPTSISMGAFPVFLIQDSPTRSGVSKAVPLFPESPESAYGFQPGLNRSNLPGRDELLYRIDETPSDAEAFAEDEWEIGDQLQQTLAPPPIRMVHTADDEWEPSISVGGLSRRPSVTKQVIDFGRRLYEEDETLFGHCEVSDQKLRPAALRYSSSTSTSLASPLSDTFSPGSTSCSISTASSSRLSPGAPPDCYAEFPEPESEDFPTEVGGPVSLDLEVSSTYAQTVVSSGSPAVLELSPMRSQPNMKNTPTNESNLFVGSPYMHSCFTLTATDPGCDSPSAVSSTQAEQPSAGAGSISRPSTPPAETQTPVSPSPYGRLGLFRHPHFRLSQLAQVQQFTSEVCSPETQRSVSSPSTYTSTSPVVSHRRAFSGARELLQAGRAGPSIVGRLRSCSANSTDPRVTGVQLNLKPSINSLSVHSARSRSNSASSALPHAPSTSEFRTLSSSKSKDSVRSKFDNLPGYATFLRDITLELWIDQASVEYLRPQFELHRYTPGQIAPALSGIRLKNRNSATITSPTRRKSTIPSPIAIPRTPPYSDQCSSAGSTTSPATSRFGPLSPSTGQEIETPTQPHFLENWGVAEFTMKKRRGWNFHHGMAESEPMLRRLTVNGVEDRDYLSREASLSVKSNGVYTVKGSEDRGRFEWKLEYLVEDRRGPSGAVMPGEKTLTPLLFTCAPELLIPEQGKKVKLLHVMRKSMIPKIQSSKLEPPLVPTTPRSLASSEKSTPSHVGTGSASKALGTIAKIVRPSSSKSRSRPTTPKNSYPYPYSTSQTHVRSGRHALEFSEHPDAFGPRKAVSYSNARPNLQEILDTQFDN